MLSILKNIFTGKNLLDTASSGIDKAILTKEEKLDLHLNFLKHTEPFKLAQRGLAFASFLLYGLSFLAYQVLAAFDNPAAYRILDGINQFRLSEIVWTIVGFYFIGGLNNIKKAGK